MASHGVNSRPKSAGPPLLFSSGRHRRAIRRRRRSRRRGAALFIISHIASPAADSALCWPAMKMAAPGEMSLPDGKLIGPAGRRAASYRRARLIIIHGRRSPLANSRRRHCSLISAAGARRALVDAGPLSAPCSGGGPLRALIGPLSPILTYLGRRPAGELQAPRRALQSSLQQLGR